MPRIDPFSLLKCLSVLLGPTGGIKSKEEVHRLANLMTKFSKKLVSKCIYIQILKTTNTDLLSQFMGAGGWNLIHMWLTDGILAKNWALIQELLELLLLCPVDIERLKSNNCPKLIKGLSKEGSHQGVRILASKLVEQWLKIVKGEAPPNSVPAQIMLVSNSTTSVTTSTSSTTISTAGTTTTTSTSTTSSASSNSAVASSQSQSQFSSSDNNNVNGCSNNSHNNNNNENAIETVQVQDLQFNSSNSVGNSTQEKTVQLRLMQQQKPQICIVTTASQNPVPVFKITIRDGNEVLTKVETDVTNILLNNDSNVESGKKSALEEKKVSEGKQVDGKSVGSGDEVEGVTNKVSASEVTETSGKDKDKDSESKAKDKSEVSSDGKSISDKENRDSHKKEEKKSSSEKKSSGSSSSSSRPSSSSKHSSSSSHRSSSSSSHKSSSHKPSSSSSSSNSRSGSSSSKDKSKDHRHHHSKHSSSSSSSSSSSKRSDRDKERQKKDQAEKDKATLEKIQGQSISSKIGKIPKKKAEDESNKSLERKSSTDSRDSSKENKQDAKKSATSSVPEKKNISISIENRKNSQDAVTTRPKTVKTYNSKFRSTGLEEEVKPPPPRSVKKPNAAIEKKIMPVKVQPLKRTSPLRETSALPSEKKAKLALDATSTTSPSDEKKGGIKLIPPKPKPMVLQESDMFMDALTASTKSKEPRKRKRKTSISKDGPSLDPKVKIDSTNHDNSRDSTPPPTSPASADEKSPLAVKPNFKFYQDTLETDEDKEEKLKNEEEKHRDDDDDDMRDHHHRHHHDDDDSRQSKTPTPENDSEEAKISDSLEEPSESGDTSKKDETGSQNSDEGLKSVLLHQKRKGPKKTLKWKTELESIRYFELDETERVNVTKTFTDMKQMEKQNEREAFQMARKLSNEDLMEERTIWKPLIPIDLPPPLVEPGKDSKEKDIQYAREKGILQALYFNRSMIPDSPAEPDEEKHHIITDPKTIPLDDLTGNKESEKDFTSIPWPEPKPQLLATSLNPPMTNYHFQTYPHTQQPQPQQPGMINSGMPGPQGPMGMMPQMPQGMMGHMNQMDLSQMPGNPNAAPGGGGGWRTGDGKVVVPDVNVNAMPPNMTGGFPQNMDTGAGPMMPPPGMMGRPPMYNQQDGYNMMGGPPMPHDDMGYNNFQGPPPPGMYGPHPGPNFPGPRAGPPPPPLHASRGRGNPGWFRGGGPLHPPPMRGSGPPPPGWRSGWRNNSNQPMPPVCRQFTKNGYCRGADKCQFLHPGVNCPPF